MTTNTERATEAQLLEYARSIVADLDELAEVAGKHHRASMAISGNSVACQVEILSQQPTRAAGVVSSETAKNYIVMVRLLVAGDAGVAQGAGCFHILKSARADAWTRENAREDAASIVCAWIKDAVPAILRGGGGADAD